jgi:hypothetical protein
MLNKIKTELTKHCKAEEKKWLFFYRRVIEYFSITKLKKKRFKSKINISYQNLDQTIFTNWELEGNY